MGMLDRALMCVCSKDYLRGKKYPGGFVPGDVDNSWIQAIVGHRVLLLFIWS